MRPILSDIYPTMVEEMAVPSSGTIMTKYTAELNSNGAVSSHESMAAPTLPRGKHIVGMFGARI